MNLLAYTKGISKKEFVKEMKLHKKLDNFIYGTYSNSEHTKGCAVGCALLSVAKLKKIELDPGFHKGFETHLGIPEWLARVEDCFFENMTRKRSKVWPVEFSEAINEGADLEKVKAPFMIYILEQALGNFDHKKYPYVLKSINDVIKLWEKYPKGPSAAWSAARSAAWSAAESAAWSAAWSAARSAAWSAARSAAWSAARSAAWSAAESAAESAAWSAAWSAARSAAYEKYADKLLELLRECK